MNNQTFIIGITGGTGCGKTTLLNLIGEKGGLILDCDAIYHELLRTDEAMLAAIERRFPGVIENGILNSLDIVSIITEVSDRFDVTIPAEEIMPENFDSAEALWALICRLDED